MIDLISSLSVVLICLIFAFCERASISLVYNIYLFSSYLACQVKNKDTQLIFYLDFRFKSLHRN